MPPHPAQRGVGDAAESIVDVALGTRDVDGADPGLRARLAVAVAVAEGTN
jgi:hypothetical protein